MAISDEARRNHDARFPNHTSTLARTDPELVEIFDTWAFDEVLQARGTHLPLEGQSTTKGETRFDEGLGLQKRIFGDRMLDTATQLPPLIGYPRTLNAIRVVDEGTSERSRLESRRSP